MAGHVTGESSTPKEQADEGWDTYQERVLRNEGRLDGLENLVRETRLADNKLVEQRADSLAKQLADMAEATRKLMEEQRAADLQQVAIWRESDREARILQAEEYARRLDVLNGEHRRTATVLTQSVTRELWNAEHQVVLDRVASLERQILLMPTIAWSDRVHESLEEKLAASQTSSMESWTARADVLNEKIEALQRTANITAGKTLGASTFYATMASAIGLIISIVIVINVLTAK